MSEILLYYRRPDPTTWVYLSSFLTIGLYFVFHRFWSVRNLDIALLIVLAPGLLMVHEGRRRHLSDLDSEAAAAWQRKSLAQPDPTSVDVGALADDGGQVAKSAIAPRATALINVQVAPDAPGKPPGEGGSNDSSGSTDALQSDSLTTENQGDAGPVASGGGDSNDGESDNDSTVANPADTELAASDDADVATTLPAKSRFEPRQILRFGFVTLFLVQAAILVRLLLDPLMVRRPLLDPNLTSGGLTFLGVSLFIFMMANVVTSTPGIQEAQGPKLGPGYALMNMLPAIPTRPVGEALGGVAPRSPNELPTSQARLASIAKALAIVAHLAIVTGIVLIGSRHFQNIRAGVGCATLYLILPYTAQMTGRVDHAVPAALLLWALLMYRKPMVGGIFLGLAGGLVYYPLFLLPLWFSFYWQRGARRFAVGVVSMLAVLMLLLSLAGTESLIDHLRRMFGLFSPFKDASELQGGFWELGLNPIWRLPVIVGFVILSAFFAIWPAQKNLGVLISGSAAVMVAAQFWHGYGGGLYIAWFLPLLLLTIFRPNLQDRVATKVVDGPRVNPLTRETRLEVEAA